MFGVLMRWLSLYASTLRFTAGQGWRLGGHLVTDTWSWAVAADSWSGGRWSGGRVVTWSPTRGRVVTWSPTRSRATSRSRGSRDSCGRFISGIALGRAGDRLGGSTLSVFTFSRTAIDVRGFEAAVEFVRVDATIYRRSGLAPTFGRGQWSEWPDS